MLNLNFIVRKKHFFAHFSENLAQAIEIWTKFWYRLYDFQDRSVEMGSLHNELILVKNFWSRAGTVNSVLCRSQVISLDYSD